MRQLYRRNMEDYRGLHCGCAPGTHAAITDLIVRHVEPCAGVLDIGAHSGALLCRLRDAGYHDLHGTDLDLTRFKLEGATITRVELNTNFAALFDRKFALITSTDVIEHLDSPRNFLIEARKLLTDDGYLAVSLPNVAFWAGRIKFLLKGELWGFGEKNYRLQRHVSPITFEQMTLMMQEIGFHLVECVSAGSFATMLGNVVTAPLWLPLRLLTGRTALGESAIFLAKKGVPDLDLSDPVHYRQRWRGIPDEIGLAEPVGALAGQRRE